MIAYISGGAGDFIAIESFLTDKEKYNITEFYLFTRAAKTIEKLIKLHKIWKNCNIKIPYTEFEIFSFNTYAFFDISHLHKLTNYSWPEIDSALDLSGNKIYPQILQNKRKFNKSEFEIKGVENDIVIDKESLADDRLVKKGRNFTKSELKNYEKIYKDKNIKYVGPKFCSLHESLQFVKGCKKFIGIDSMCSVFACRQKNIKEIEVKTINKIYKKWLPIYDPFNKITKLIDKI